MRLSQQIRHQQRLAIFNFFVLSILLFAGQSGVSAQGSVNLKVEEGKQIRSSVSFTNDCEEAQSYRLAPTKYVRIEGATTQIVINGRSTVNIGFVFDAAGLEPNVYSDRIGLIPDRNTQRPLGKRTTITKNPACRTSDCELLPMCKGQCKEEPVKTVCKGKNNVINIEITVTGKVATPTPTPKIVVKTSPTKVTPSVTPTETPTETPRETPTETSPATMSPVETPVTPTPAMEAEVSQNPSPPEPAFVKYLKYPVLISALVFVLSLGTLGGKNLLDKRKYGKNALQNLSSLKKAIHVKEQLSQKWMKRRKTQNLHAIGVGKTGAAGGYCIQLFVENANGEMPENPPIQLLPEKYRQFPIVIYEMARAEFLSGENHECRTKECHDTIIGGISGANTNLANEYGTIGYFCAPTILRPIRKFRKEVYLLSNSHVFADLNKAKKDDNDLIQQPSPGENKKHNFVASLENYVPLLFDNDTENPNYIDAAIARLFQGKEYRLEIPVIGKINDFVPKEKVEIKQDCRKFGRTTGYTEGQVFSIHLSIWIRYAATGQESFFKEQFLIVPSGAHSDFVKGGDSGSLVADREDKAIGLIFAGANSEGKFKIENLSDVDAANLLSSISTEKIKSFGVANPISEVFKGLNVKLML